MGDDDDSDVEPPTRNLMMSVRVEALAVLELVVIAGVAAYVFFTVPPDRMPWNASCADLSCYNLAMELYTAMDLRLNPCDDFYLYACGRWADSHPDDEDQFRYLEGRVYRTANEKLRERMASLPAPDKPLSTLDKAAISYLSCIEVHTRRIDVPWKINELLFNASHSGVSSLSQTIRNPQEMLDLLVSLALNLDIDILFKIRLAPDPRNESRRIVSVAHSESLLKWKRHREQLLSPQALADCIRSFVNVLSGDNNAPREKVAAALVKMDVDVTTKMAASAALSLGSDSFVTFGQITALEATGSSDSNVNGAAGGADNWWLSAFNAALGDKGNVSADEPLYAADASLFALTRELLAGYPAQQLDFYVRFHVVRYLAPYTSYRLVEALFAPENHTAVTVYYADACAYAASRLTSFALATYVFKDIVPQSRIEAAYNKLKALKNKTGSAASSWTGQPSLVEERLGALSSLVAWPSRLNSSGDSVDQFLAHLPDFRGYYVEIYIDAMAAIRNREKAQLLDRTAGAGTKIVREEDSPFPGLRPMVRYSPWYASILVSPSALLEPLLVNTSEAFGMGAFGHLAAHELWHAALAERPLGIAPQSDVTMEEEQLARHKCVAGIYKNAGASSEQAAKGASENVADVVGLEAAYAVFREGNGSAPSEDAGNATDVMGFTASHYFFVASCFKWCAATPDGLSKTSLGYTPPRLRCNVPVAMLGGGSAFSTAFGCKPDSKMVKMAAGASCMAQNVTL